MLRIVNSGDRAVMKLIAAIVMFALAVPALAQEPEKPYDPAGWLAPTPKWPPQMRWVKKRCHWERKVGLADGSCG
jgi:hypothetical protein